MTRTVVDDSIMVVGFTIVLSSVVVLRTEIVVGDGMVVVISFVYVVVIVTGTGVTVTVEVDNEIEVYV